MEKNFLICGDNLKALRAKMRDEMKKILLTSVLWLMMGLWNTCLAIDLNAPAEKPITVKSEIDRGWDAGFDCSMRGMKEESKCYLRIVEMEKQHNTDTQPFLFGLHASAWCHMALAPHIRKSYYGTIYGNMSGPEKKGRFADYTFELDMDNARFHLREFRRIQSELGISDEELYQIVGRHFKLDTFTELLKQWDENNKGK